MTRGRPRAILLAAALATLLADQVTKQVALAVLEPGRRVVVIDDVFGFRLTGNPGGAFGILTGASLLFFLASIAIVAVVLVWGWRSRTSVVPLGLVAGGGLGNLADRLLRPPGAPNGHVVDFIDFSFWPTFNLADSAIVIGVVLLVVANLKSREG